MLSITNPVTVEVTQTRLTTTIRLTDATGHQYEYSYTLPLWSHESHRSPAAVDTK